MKATQKELKSTDCPLYNRIYELEADVLSSPDNFSLANKLDDAYLNYIKDNDYTFFPKVLEHNEDLQLQFIISLLQKVNSHSNYSISENILDLSYRMNIKLFKEVITYLGMNFQERVYCNEYTSIVIYYEKYKQLIDKYEDILKQDVKFLMQFTKRNTNIKFINSFPNLFQHSMAEGHIVYSMYIDWYDYTTTPMGIDALNEFVSLNNTIVDKLDEKSVEVLTQNNIRSLFSMGYSELFKYIDKPSIDNCVDYILSKIEDNIFTENFMTIWDTISKVSSSDDREMMLIRIIKSNSHLFELFYNKTNLLTNKIYIELAEHIPCTLLRILPQSKQTIEMCRIAVAANPDAFKECAYDCITKELCLLAISHSNGKDNITSVPFSMWNDELILACVGGENEYLSIIDGLHFIGSELITQIIDKSPRSVTQIRKATESDYLYALRMDVDIFDIIEPEKIKESMCDYVAEHKPSYYTHKNFVKTVNNSLKVLKTIPSLIKRMEDIIENEPNFIRLAIEINPDVRLFL